MNIYVSTSAIKKPFDIADVLERYDQMELSHIELGSSHKHCENLNEVLKEFKHMNFIMHNYFPPPQRAFALNLSSLDENIRKASINHAKFAIDLCVSIGSPIYSIHAGMIADPNRIEFFKGFSFDESDVKEDVYEECFNLLVDSCKKINEYAEQKGIKFAIETSGGHPKKFKYLMMTTENEFKRLLNEIPNKNFGILLDIGHYTISEAVYPEEDIKSFIHTFKTRIFQVHIHHNDGSNDQHLPPTAKELSLLSSFAEGTIFVLESMQNEPESILQSMSDIQSYV